MVVETKTERSVCQCLGQPASYYGILADWCRTRCWHLWIYAAGFRNENRGPDNFFAIPVAAVLGIPLYIRAETAIPIGVALMSKGMSIGTVIALIIGGAGMAIPEMTMLASIFRKKLVAIIVAAIFLTAVISGYIFNLIM